MKFDIDIFKMLTLKNTKIIKACPQLYKFVPKNMRFDFMSKEDSWYEFNCRTISFKITNDTYEYIITNLYKKEFSMDDIKCLYNKPKHRLDRSNMHLNQTTLHSKEKTHSIGNIHLIIAL